MTILGIDPGTARMGWGVLKLNKETENLKLEDLQEVNGNLELLGYGCVVTSKDDEAGARLMILHKELGDLIVKHKPDMLAVERLFFGMNARTAIAVGQATGIIRLTAAEHKIPLTEYTGLQVKLRVAGHGRADKKVVQQKIRQILHSNKRTMSFTAKDKAWDDAADALAIAICHIIAPTLIK
jgi:crossover junction endodeoxyribonuclease RuvC